MMPAIVCVGMRTVTGSPAVTECAVMKMVIASHAGALSIGIRVRDIIPIAIAHPIIATMARRALSSVWGHGIMVAAGS